MPRSYTVGQLYALVALMGGADVAAEALDIDVDDFESLVDGRRVSEDFKDDFDNTLRKWKRQFPDLAESVNRVGGVLDWYPELLEIIDNDGVSEALVRYPKFADIFYKDFTKWRSKTPEVYKRGKNKGQPRTYKTDVKDKQGRVIHKKGETVYKTYSDGGVHPNALKAIINLATHTRKGKKRKRGQLDLSPMIEALIKDGFEIGIIDESAFWRWFEDNVSP